MKQRPLIGTSLFLAALFGCTNSAGTAVSGPGAKGVEVSVEEDASLFDPLAKSPNFQQCKEVLQRYDARRNSDKKQSAAELAAVSVKTLATQMPLSKEDMQDLERIDFTPADALYLEEVAFLRDVERLNRFKALPPAERAAAIFQWVSRHIYLKDRPNAIPFAAPAQLSLVAGCGLPWDRAFAFLALARQCGLDGFLVGPPEAKDKPFTVLDQQRKTASFAPFWGVAARVGKEFLLFDPYTGKPAGTLAKLRTDAEAAKALAAVRRVFPLTAEQIQKSEPFLAPPLSACAVRMQLFAKDWKGDANPAIDVVKVLSDSKDAAANAKATVAVWNVPGDLGNFSRVHLLSSQNNNQLLAPLRDQVVPWGAFPRVFDRLETPDARSALTGYFANAFMKSHFAADANQSADPPVEALFRGSLNDTVGKFQQLRDRAEAERNVLSKDPKLEQETLNWCVDANAAYAALSRAQRSGDTAATLSAQAAVDRLRGNAQAPLQWINRTMQSLISKEGLYYIAMCVHEKAERLRLRGLADPKAADPAKQADAWKDAADWWERYLAYSVGSAEQGDPARDAHVKGLLETARNSGK